MSGQEEEVVTVRSWVLLRDWGPRRAGEIIPAGELDPAREVALLDGGFVAAELEEEEEPRRGSATARDGKPRRGRKGG